MDYCNNCKTCDYYPDKDNGHCYMFKEEPKCYCMQHTDLKKKVSLGDLEDLLLRARVNFLNKIQDNI